MAFFSPSPQDKMHAVKIWYSIPVLLIMAGCASAPKPEPSVVIATVPTRAPKPTATPITIMSNEAPPPALGRPSSERMASSPKSSPNQDNDQFGIIKPLTNRGDLTDAEFRYVNRIIVINNHITRNMVPSGNFFTKFLSARSIKALRQADRMHRALRPPAYFAESYAQSRRGMKLIINSLNRFENNPNQPLNDIIPEYQQGVQDFYWGMSAVVTRTKDFY